MIARILGALVVVTLFASAPAEARKKKRRTYLSSEEGKKACEKYPAEFIHGVLGATVEANPLGAACAYRWPVANPPTPQEIMASLKAKEKIRSAHNEVILEERMKFDTSAAARANYDQMTSFLQKGVKVSATIDGGKTKAKVKIGDEPERDATQEAKEARADVREMTGTDVKKGKASASIHYQDELVPVEGFDDAAWSARYGKLFVLKGARCVQVTVKTEAPEGDQAAAVKLANAFLAK